MIKIIPITSIEQKMKGRGWTLEYGFSDTPFGPCFVAATSCGLCSFQFVEGTEQEILSAFETQWPEALYVRNDAMAIEIVRNVVSGYSFSLTLHLVGTPFQLNVWKALLEIPLGHVVSYSELAQVVQQAKAVRAVASAVARNPVGLIVPCHRVIRKEGTVGQYHWGSDRKADIIDWERRKRDIISQ